MNILGLGGSIHDFAACIITEAATVAVEDERLTRIRYGIGSSTPCRHSASYCLDSVGRSLESIEVIAGNVELLQVLEPSAFPGMLYTGHHTSHAFSAFFTSTFDNAAILVVDGAGTRIAGAEAPGATETLTYARGAHNTIEVLGQVYGDLDGVNPITGRETLMSNSLGEFYRAIAEALGLGWLSGPGKAMALAAYADARQDDRFVEAIIRYVDLLPQGQCRIRMNGSDGLIEGLSAIRNRALLSDDKFVVDSAIAHAGQRILEIILLHALHFLSETVDSKNLCFVGGVALNSLANGRVISQAGFEQVHVLFAPGDSGTALGAAMWAAIVREGNGNNARRFPLKPFLGRQYSVEEIDAALARANLRVRSPRDPVGEAAQLLANGKIVCWFQGRSEFGPRALGNRCILADPRLPHVRDHINKNIKGREWYRPLAPAVMASYADEYFECGYQSPWMQFVWPVRDRYRSLLPAITHVDGGARVQTVSAEDNPRFYALLKRFGEITRMPILLNTSFNIKRAPIVESPADAIRTFLDSPLDALVIGDRIVLKSQGSRT